MNNWYYVKCDSIEGFISAYSIFEIHIAINSVCVYSVTFDTIGTPYYYRNESDIMKECIVNHIHKLYVAADNINTKNVLELCLKQIALKGVISLGKAYEEI